VQLVEVGASLLRALADADVTASGIERFTAACSALTAPA
jgi:hypothetical protein